MFYVRERIFKIVNLRRHTKVQTIFDPKESTQASLLKVDEVSSLARSLIIFGPRGTKRSVRKESQQQKLAFLCNLGIRI